MWIINNREYASKRNTFVKPIDKNDNRFDKNKKVNNINWDIKKVIEANTNIINLKNEINKKTNKNQMVSSIQVSDIYNNEKSISISPNKLENNKQNNKFGLNVEDTEGKNLK